MTGRWAIAALLSSGVRLKVRIRRSPAAMRSAPTPCAGGGRTMSVKIEVANEESAAFCRRHHERSCQRRRRVVHAGTPGVQIDACVYTINHPAHCRNSKALTSGRSRPWAAVDSSDHRRSHQAILPGLIYGLIVLEFPRLPPSGITLALEKCQILGGPLRFAPCTTHPRRSLPVPRKIGRHHWCADRAGDSS
jgi:hypothetical protein